MGHSAVDGSFPVKLSDRDFLKQLLSHSKVSNIVNVFTSNGTLLTQAVGADDRHFIKACLLPQELMA